MKMLRIANCSCDLDCINTMNAISDGKGKFSLYLHYNDGKTVVVGDVDQATVDKVLPQFALRKENIAK